MLYAINSWFLNSDLDFKGTLHLAESPPLLPGGSRLVSQKEDRVQGPPVAALHPPQATPAPRISKNTEIVSQLRSDLNGSLYPPCKAKSSFQRLSKMGLIWG